MSVSTFTKQLKELIGDYLSPTGEILTEPIGRYGKKNLDERRKTLLRRFVYLILHTRFVRPETRYYLSNKYITLYGITELMEAQGKGRCVSTVQSIIWNDKEKIVGRFGEKIIIDIVEYNLIDENDYERRILEAIVHYSNCGQYMDRIALELPTPVITTEMSDMDFDDFLIWIAPFTKSHMSFLSSALPAEGVGYIKWLLSCTMLTDTDMDRKERLLALLGSPDDDIRLPEKPIPIVEAGLHL